MKIIDKKLVIATIVTVFLLTCVFVLNKNESYALSDLSVPEITSFSESKIEKGALTVEFKSDNTGNDYSYELLNVTTEKVNMLGGSSTSYTYQNLTPGEYKVQIRACPSANSDYSCSDYSEVKSFISSEGVVAKLNKTSYVFDGTVKKPTVIVTEDGDNLTIDKDYKVTYPSGMKKIGEYTVVVTGIGDYDFNEKLSYVIKPPATIIKSKSAKQTSITVKFESKKGGVKYRLAYKKASEKDYKFVNSSDTSETIKNLSSGTKYNLKVRTFKAVNDKKYYSAWSKEYSIKTKGKSSSSGGSKNSGGSNNSGNGGTSSGNNSNNNDSKKNNTTKTNSCGKNQMKSNGRCVCISGYVRNKNNNCVKNATKTISCGKNQMKSNGRCVCSSGFVRDKNNNCVAKTQVSSTSKKQQCIDKCNKIKVTWYNKYGRATCLKKCK